MLGCGEWHSMCMVRAQLVGAGTFLPSCGSQRLNSGCQTQQQAPLPIALTF